MSLPGSVIPRIEKWSWKTPKWITTGVKYRANEIDNVVESTYFPS